MRFVAAYFDFVDGEDRGDDGAFRLIFESDLGNDPAVRERVDRVARLTMRAVADTVASDTGLSLAQAELLSTAGGIRDGGWGIALDDVGAEPASLALMPFLDPDVIKLDLRLIQDTPTEDLAEVINAGSNAGSNEVTATTTPAKPVPTTSKPSRVQTTVSLTPKGT